MTFYQFGLLLAGFSFGFGGAVLLDGHWYGLVPILAALPVLFSALDGTAPEEPT